MDDPLEKQAVLDIDGLVDTELLARRFELVGEVRGRRSLSLNQVASRVGRDLEEDQVGHDRQDEAKEDGPEDPANDVDEHSAGGGVSLHPERLRRAALEQRPPVRIAGAVRTMHEGFVVARPHAGGYEPQVTGALAIDAQAAQQYEPGVARRADLTRHAGRVRGRRGPVASWPRQERRCRPFGRTRCSPGAALALEKLSQSAA